MRDFAHTPTRTDCASAAQSPSRRQRDRPLGKEDEVPASDDRSTSRQDPRTRARSSDRRTPRAIRAGDGRHGAPPEATAVRHAPDTGAGARLSGEEARTMSGDLAYLGLAEAAELIRDKKLSPVEYATALLARIERHDPKLNAFIALTPERALSAARAVEAEITAGRWRGPFHGMSYALKDIIDVEGIPTTAHSRVLADNGGRSHAAVTERLESAGGVLLGKLSTHEFVIGGPSFEQHKPYLTRNHLLFPTARFSPAL